MEAKLKKFVTFLGAECSFLVSSTCLEGDSGRDHEQPMQRGGLLGLERTDQIQEVVTSHLKKALLVVHKVGAVEMMGEENREVARSLAGNPKLILFSLFSMKVLI